MVHIEETAHNVVPLKEPDGKKWSDSKSNAFVFVRVATDNGVLLD